MVTIGVRAALADLTYGIGRSETLEELRWVVTMGVRQVVSGDLASCTDVNLTHGEVIAPCEPEGVPTQIVEALGRLAHQHPLITHSSGAAGAISDHLSHAAFRNLELYQDVYRHLGARDQLAVSLVPSPDRRIGVAVNRSARGFSQDERARMDELRASLGRGYRRILARERALELLSTVGDGDGPTGVVVMDRDRVEFANEIAWRWLAAYLPSAQPWRTPEALRGWAQTGSRAFGVSGSDGRLRVTRLHETEDGQVILELQEDTSRLDILTPREAEVLRLVATGQDNARIAQRLGVSRSTVENHLQAIYRKLEVSNRTSAAAVLRARFPAN